VAVDISAARILLVLWLESSISVMKGSYGLVPRAGQEVLTDYGGSVLWSLSWLLSLSIVVQM
jgi:hypothetical protein